MPYISQVASGKLEMLSIYGSDYDTVDGTGVRDYVHVVDLAKGHVKALLALKDRPQIFTLNLGTGKGYSVLEIIGAFEKVSGKKIPCRVVGKRPGDVAVCYADASLAEEIMGWKAECNIQAMCRDVWRWQSKNPYGYQ